MHHNRRPWSGPTDIVDLLDLDPVTSAAAGDYLPRFRFLLDDLTRVDQQDLRDRPLTPSARITLLLLKIAAGNPRLVDNLRSWTGDLGAILEPPDGSEDFVALLTYIENVGESPTDELQQLVSQLGPKAEEAYVTTAEMLRAEGRAQGEASARVSTLVELLTLKFGQLSPATLETIQAASTDQLKTWTARVLTATTLDEALR